MQPAEPPPGAFPDPPDARDAFGAPSATGRRPGGLKRFLLPMALLAYATVTLVAVLLVRGSWFGLLSGPAAGGTSSSVLPPCPSGSAPEVSRTRI